MDARGRSWNWLLWIGFGLALLAAFSYTSLFILFPPTRDFPWANLLLFVIGLVLLAVGMARAFRQPDWYRGKVAGSILTVISLALFGLFAVGTYMAAHSLPLARTALAVGQTAPDFQLSDADGNPVVLSRLLQDHRAVLLIFYRGYW